MKLSRCLCALMTLGLMTAIGCDNAKDKTKDLADKSKDISKDLAGQTKDMAAKAAQEAKDAIVTPIKDAYPKIEEKIKALTGDKLTQAKTMYEALKKLIDEFTTAPADKTKDLGDKIKTAFDELKKHVGL